MILDNKKKIIIACCQDSYPRCPAISAFSYYAVSLLGDEDIKSNVSIIMNSTPWHGASSCCRWKRCDYTQQDILDN
jgi:hypothetical protein